MQEPLTTFAAGIKCLQAKDFVIFASLVYSSWWMTRTSAAEGLRHDFNLCHKILMYEDLNPAISLSIQLKLNLKHHLCRTDSALFSDIVPTDVARYMHWLINSFELYLR